MDAGAETFGAGCAAIPTDGAGSFNGMATDPVATAASDNPLLKTLVAAVGEAGLVDTLNSAEGSPSSPRPTTRSPRSRRQDLDALLARQGDADQDPDPPRGGASSSTPTSGR